MTNKHKINNITLEESMKILKGSDFIKKINMKTTESEIKVAARKILRNA